MGFVANFIHFPAVQKIENRFRFDKVTDSLKVETFLRQCMYTVSQKTSHLWLAVTLTHITDFNIFGRNVTDKVGNETIL